MLYSPELLIQTTLSGQLCLLMCIEALEYCGFEVISANTDGIISKVPVDRRSDFDEIVKWFEETCGFTMEASSYRAVYSQDVNNFIIVKDDGEIKAKGIYSWKGSAWDDPLSKNPETLVCLDALYAFLATGKPIRQTIYECKDVRRFVSVRTVQGGSMKDDIYLGKAIRWYYAKGSIDSIKNKKNGHKVPKTEQAKPLMTLPDTLPDDIDYIWYIDNAEQLLLELGYKDKAMEGSLI